MPVATLTGQPSAFTAGDTARFIVGDSRYKASDGWTLSFILRRGTTVITTAGSADGDNFTVSPATTSSTPPGEYRAVAVFSETATGDKDTLDKGIIRITPNLSNTTVGPRRTAYNTARAALDAKLSGDMSFSFNGQSASSFPLESLQKTVDRLYIEALAEDRELGIGNTGGLVRIQTRME